MIADYRLTSHYYQLEVNLPNKQEVAKEKLKRNWITICISISS